MYFTPEDEIKGFWYVNPITRFPDFIVGMLLFQLYERLKTRISLPCKEVSLKSHLLSYFNFLPLCRRYT